jgi:hypothetical protein
LGNKGAPLSKDTFCIALQIIKEQESINERMSELKLNLAKENRRSPLDEQR